jgi:hypothetical protein
MMKNIERIKGGKLIRSVRDWKIAKAIKIMKSLKNIDMLIMTEHPMMFGCYKEKFQTPLMFGIDSGSNDLVECALKLGAYPSRRIYLSIHPSQEQLHPIIYATKKGNIEPIELLIEYGANIEYKTPNGNTPLTIAVLNGNYKLVKYMVEKGVSPNIKTKTGNSPFIICKQKIQEIEGLIDILNKKEKTSEDQELIKINRKLIDRIKKGKAQKDIERIYELLIEETEPEYMV